MAKTILGTAALSAGTGKPPSTMWNKPFVVLRSLFGLCSTPCASRYECTYGETKTVLRWRQRHRTTESGAIQHERVRGQARRATRAHVREVGIQKTLNARVSRTQASEQQLIFLIIIAEQRTDDLQEMRIGGAATGRLAERRQLQVDVSN